MAIQASLPSAARAEIPSAPRDSRSGPNAGISAVVLYPVLIVGLTTALSYLLQLKINVTVLPLYVVAVMLSAWRWGLAGGAWGTLLAWFSYLFFFIPPILTFYILDLESAARMAELVVTSLLTLVLTVSLRRSRERFRSEHQHLREVLRQLPSGVLIADARSQNIVLANEQVEKIWGRPVRCPMTVEDYVRWTGYHPDGRPYDRPERPLIRSLTRGDAVLGEEIEIEKADGSRATIQVNSAPVRDADGTVVEGVVTIQDVTDRRRAEEGVRFLSRASMVLSSSLDVASVLENLAGIAVPHLGSWCSIYLADGEADGLPLRRAAVAASNPADRVLLDEIEARYPPERASERGVAKVVRTGEPLLFPDVSEDILRETAHSPEHYELIRRLSVRSWMGVPVSSGGKTLGAIVLAWSGKGRRYGPADLDLARALAERVALAIENGRLYLKAENEIQERKRAEAEIRELNARLEGMVKERTRELEETVRKLDSFAYTVAHDLRAPLRGVSGLGHLLLEEYGGKTLDVAGQDYLRRMTDCAQRMDTLITDLLSYSRLSRRQIKIEVVDTDRLVVGVLEQHKDLLRERKATVNVRRELPAVLGNDEMLAHALSNLLTNAVKFVAPDVQPRVDIWAESGGETVRLWVQDNGIGVAPDYHERIFGIFQRLNPSEAYPGTGIGLAIVRAAVGSMGGEVGVESAAGKGSRFWIELPRAPAAGRDGAPSRPLASPAANGR